MKMVWKYDVMKNDNNEIISNDEMKIIMKIMKNNVKIMKNDENE